MATQIFVNLPVTDLARSVAFYEAVGFSPDERMRDENACGMRVTDHISVMLLAQPFFATSTDEPIADATATHRGDHRHLRGERPGGRRPG